MSISAECRREAHEQVDKETRKRMILALILKRGDMSSEQIMDKLGTRDPNNVRPRLCELKQSGFLEESGKRMTRNGRWETVYSLTDIGRKMAEAKNVVL